MGDAEVEVRRAVAALVARDGQKAVAEAVGVSQPTVSRYLAGEHRLTIKLATGLGRTYPHLRDALARVLGAVAAP